MSIDTRNLDVLGPFVEGVTAPSWTITYLRADNTPVDISGAAFTGVLFDAEGTRRITLTAGSYSITDATAGEFTYAPSATDTAQTGEWLWQTLMTLSGKIHAIRAMVVIESDISS